MTYGAPIEIVASVIAAVSGERIDQASHFIGQDITPKRVVDGLASQHRREQLSAGVRANTMFAPACCVLVPCYANSLPFAPHSYSSVQTLHRNLCKD